MPNKIDRMNAEEGPEPDEPIARGRLQFSLRKLLLAIFLFALSLGYVVLVRRDVMQRREIAWLSQQGGYFNVEDPSKVYVRSVPMHDAGGWRWHIYLPPETDWSIKCTIDDIASTGYPTPAMDERPNMDPYSRCRPNPYRQLELETFISHDIDGRPSFCLQTKGIYSSNTTIGMSTDQIRERFAPVKTELQILGSCGTAVGAPTKRIELLRLRIFPTGPVTNTPVPGLLVWLEQRP